MIVNQFNDDIDVLVKYGEVIEQVSSGKMSEGVCPTLDDLPFPIERIEQAIDRLLKSPDIPDHLKPVAFQGLQFLEFFKQGADLNEKMARLRKDQGA